MRKLPLKCFLKKYSTLSDEFIDDFYAIYDFDESNVGDFVINLELVTKWLDVRKNKLKKTLLTSYEKNIDWVATKQKQGSKISKSNREIIMLTPDCFKRICLLSKTSKGEHVRTYYLELEKLINQYKDHIIKALEKTVNMLENNQKEPPDDIKSAVYVLKSPKDIDGMYRFGQTMDFKQRLQNYNSAHSDKMRVAMIYETDDAKKIEGCVIAQVKELRYKKRKDFYQIDLKMLKAIVKDCKDLTLRYKRRIQKSVTQNSKQSGGQPVDNIYLYIKHA